ncbi:ABC transporter permease [Paenibacillus sp. MZ04-78.2]|uniref:ABC transporter permease n=1 Tax=Paenibacillus sp. MZ04-78.2 TaxID=2962034 RepID=UPI0020B78D1B|nr:ABC transporter permease [Paenibacillus sp. MZ04-78.2]MCP3774585.1 ABC transporter permease [Paenibacillus sp. MZ04-78.2]
MYHFLKEIIINRQLIFKFATQDFRSRYLGSYLGILWAFVHPSLMILIYWFVFQVGFKSMPIGNIPFLLWLMTGLVPWFFLSESITNAANAIVDNSYLVKKVVFKVNMLPSVKIVSSLFIHLFFIAVLFVLFFLYGFGFSYYNIQIIYYLFSTLIFVFGISLISSCLVVFLKDIGQIINMLLQCCFWLTPIFWSFDVVPKEYHFWFKFNPLYYIVEGYRQTFLFHHWFWEAPTLTIYFWSVNVIILFIGTYLFKKLRPHFADLL